MSELIAEEPAIDERLAEALWVSADVTVAVGAIAAALPPASHTTLVGAVFLAAAWALVWRGDDDRVRAFGLAFGGIVIPGRIEVGRLLRETGRAFGWGLAVGAAIALPYFVGWRLWWNPRLTFSLSVRPFDFADEALGQLLVIALPEEVFYRGYLQSRLDEVWPPTWRIGGARVGPGLLASAAIFALGHVATVPLPARLAVFFPALLFGWLRARTGGVGSSVVLHAFCNVYSQLLGRGYGVY